METIQYIDRTHATKEDARRNKVAADRMDPGGPRFRSAVISFDDLVENHRKGMSFRLMPTNYEGWNTSTVLIDIDNSEDDGNTIGRPNITAGELERMIDLTGLRGRFTQSTSGSPYKWHIFIDIGVQVYSEEEYYSFRKVAEDALERAFREIRGVDVCPHLSDPKFGVNSFMYAPCVEEPGDFTVSSLTFDPSTMTYGFTVSEPHAEITKKNPVLRTEVADSEFNYRMVPLTLPGFARWLVVNGLLEEEKVEGLRCHFHITNALKYMRPGKSKSEVPVCEGERYTSFSAFMLKLYSQARAYNLWLDEHGHPDHKFSYYEIRDSFSSYIRNAYEEGSGFTYEEMLANLDNVHHRYGNLSDSDYLELPDVKKYSTGRHSARTRNFTKCAALSVIDKFAQGDSVVFPSESERDAALAEAGVSLRTIKSKAKEQGMAVKVASGAKRGRKAGISLEGLTAIGKFNGSTFCYYGRLPAAEKKFLQRRGYKVAKMEPGGQHGNTGK